MTERHTCACCGLPIDVAQDIGMMLPDTVFEMYMGGAREGHEYIADRCFAAAIVKGERRLYVRSILALPSPHPINEFRFGIWVEVPEKKGIEFVENRDSPKYLSFMAKGKSDSALWCWRKDTFGAKMVIAARREDHQPYVIGGDPWVQEALQVGITHKEYKEIVRRFDAKEEMK